LNFGPKSDYDFESGSSRLILSSLPAYWWHFIWFEWMRSSSKTKCISPISKQ